MFQPQSHFFTDPASLSQTAAEAFGPKSTELFDLTARFQSSGGQAYAICKGIVFVQPQTADSQLVNLVLRPYQQPVNGLNIRYFVYRGLQKADFFDGASVLPGGVGRSDFINRINQAFEDFYTTRGEPLPYFLASYIGYDPVNQPDDKALDSFFFKETHYVEANGAPEEQADEAFELPMVQAGDTLGHFSTGECGMDVVLGYGDYRLGDAVDEFAFDLVYARAAQARIDLADVTDPYQRKRIREQAVQFLDAAAFYGFHVGNGVVTITEAGSRVRKKGSDIHTSIVSSFHTQHNLYLYIQSDRGRSYNYYGNYSLEPGPAFSMQVGNSAETLAETTFGTQDWPVHILQSTQEHGEPNNLTYVRLVTDGNPEAMLYVHVGELVNATKNNFMGAERLRPPEDPERLSINAYIPDLILSNPAVENGSNKQTVATFNILIYHGKRTDYVVEEIDAPEQFVGYNTDFFDDVFDQPDASPILVSESSNGFSVVSVQKIKVVSINEGISQNSIAAFQTLIVRDSIPTMDDSSVLEKRVSYVTELVDILDFQIAKDMSITKDTIGFSAMAGNVRSSQTFQLPAPYRFALITFTDGLQTIKGINLLVEDNSRPIKIIVGISKEENERLLNLITDHGLGNPRLFLATYDLVNNSFISERNVRYKKYRLAISAENQHNSLGLYFPEEEITVFSLDDNYHFSSAYSRHMQEEPLSLIEQVIRLK